MQFATIATRAQVGIDAPPVLAEIHLSSGLPHTAIVGEHTGTIMNLVDREARPAQDALLTIARDDPARTLAEVRHLAMPPRHHEMARHLMMPRHHDVRAKDVNEKRLGAVLALAHERDLRDFASFLLLEQLGPRTLQSLALVAESTRSP